MSKTVPDENRSRFFAAAIYALAASSLLCSCLTAAWAQNANGARGVKKTALVVARTTPSGEAESKAEAGDIKLVSEADDAPFAKNAPPASVVAALKSEEPKKSGDDAKDAAAKEKSSINSSSEANSSARGDSMDANLNANSSNPLMSYRVGGGDVLDVRVVNVTSLHDSTLYTVAPNGLLELPLLSQPVSVSELTPYEIAAKIADALKREEVLDGARVFVRVRDYASHTVTVAGEVGIPGSHVLRREAVPLYVVVAESLPRPAAARVMITSRATKETRTIDLSDAAQMNALVRAGDLINVVARPPEFVYVGGSIGAPGQREFRSGMKLTQAILAAGGATRSGKLKARIARRQADGHPTTLEFNLTEIQKGIAPDPPVQAGDYIEIVSR